MPIKRDKPQGESGPIRIGDGGTEWQVIEFPRQKEERECLIARLFVEGFGHYVVTQSEPSFAPFGQPLKNEENNLDFTVETSRGVKLMELAEFAPLTTHGPKFATAPAVIQPHEKANLVEQLIHNKSGHQGGEDRFLVLYITEHGFWIDPITIERVRRKLLVNPPHFDRVYYVSVRDLNSASVSEIFPGKPHHIFGQFGDAQLDNNRAMLSSP